MTETNFPSRDTQAKEQEESRGSPLEVFITFLKLGLSSFGGPVAHIGYFHKAMVEERKWLSETQFAQLLAIAQFLPGPASSQLGFALGMQRAGSMGALAAFTAFTLPSALILVGFASLLPLLSSTLGESLIHGLKLVAVVVVADAVLSMANKLCPDKARKSIALGSAALLLLFGGASWQIFVVCLGALLGLVLCRPSPSPSDQWLTLPYGKGLGVCLLALFVMLLFGLPWIASLGDPLIQLVEVFYRAGALVFGGGHVVLPLLEEAVMAPGWIPEEVFLSGYGAAQAIPGPMFAFASFLGALVPSGHASWVGATVALLMIFLPGFLLMAAALPFWHPLSQNTRATQAIAGINAAVVGLLGAALYDPIFVSAIGSGLDLAICVIGMMLLMVWKCSPLGAVLWCVLASAASTLL